MYQRHVIIKIVKVKNKERILKAEREKFVMHMGSPIRLSEDLSAETLQAEGSGVTEKEKC